MKNTPVNNQSKSHIRKKKTLKKQIKNYFHPYLWKLNTFLII